MILSAPIIEKIHQALVEKNWEKIDTIVANSSQFKDKKTRIQMERSVNDIILESAFQGNLPDTLQAIHKIPTEGADTLFSLILKKYIETGDKRWLNALFNLSEKLGKKSLQSKIVSRIVQELITYGISSSNPAYIECGLEVLDKITFRKYRSDCIIDASFGITRWTIISGNTTILFRIRDLIKDISDVSKRAALHAEIALAFATIAINKEDFDLFLEGIHYTTEIHQKVRRKETLNQIIGNGTRSAFGKNLLNIRVLANRFDDLPPDLQKEFINSLIEHYLDRIKSKEQIYEDFCFLDKNKPPIHSLLILNLLKKAELSGDSWYLTTAIPFILNTRTKERFPVKEVVRAGVAIARATHSSQALIDLLPYIEGTGSQSETSGIYLQFLHIILELDDFDHAISLFSRIKPTRENMPLYYSCYAKLLEESILHDQVSQQLKNILGTNDPSVNSYAISMAVRQIGHATPFPEIVKHSSSLRQLLTLNSGHDSDLTYFITTLTNRGFLDTCDAFILVDLAKLIQDPSAREQAISTVVMKLAEIGVKSRSRDLLQQAVGITCLIEGKAIRSSTLNSIIDDATRLAATDGDLDLLLRMRVWSSSFLDAGLVVYAIKNIIEGIIKYATSKQDPEVLDEAYRLAQEIDDPSLRLQISELIAESFVRIGCDRIQGFSRDPKAPVNISALLRPFRKSLELLNAEERKPQISLKIAGMIDIILLSSKKSASHHYLLPLAMYSIEIENPLERNAMMLRVVGKLNEEIADPDSADPYETLAYILQNHYHLQITPEISNLIHRLLDLVHNPFVRLKGLCALADSAHRIHDDVLCRELLDEVYQGISNLTAQSQKVLVLADLVPGYRDIDPDKARICIQEGLEKLRAGVESDQNAFVRRQVVAAIVRMGNLLGEDVRMNLIREIIADVSDPVEYVTALIAAYSLENEKQDQTNLHHISEAIDKIDSPYTRALLMLKLVPLAIQGRENNFALNLLDRAEQVAKIINIQHVADAIRDDAAGVLIELSRRQDNARFLKKAADILAQIEDDQLRQTRLAQIGFAEATDTIMPYTRIMMNLTRIVDEGSPPSQVTTLEQTVRSVPDRGKRALVYCRLSIFCRDRDDNKTAKRMLQNAIQEADIIRPLSKRAYIRCDMAIKMYTAGYESIAQDILDRAIDAATNIRQSVLRDAVFNELGLVMRMMQGGGPE
ncbi:hypothetical protein [Methanoregula sp.]|uniref:hypothetical protein n=1 Tax=Methanoregula sp. TaxID=2052170 RepID=UPI002C4504FA|nr:hypothetical protein [Methanoregula sp.]HVP96681.1 hypothetical protein [Methanoregula sp.]